ncbi:MAG TPA: L-threonylcarbamoyladenylate synthase [Bryobacteraceae bacterium]|nr:L-threonylcarbamoyladenylate synthase [Bryobacteraceae bacterium]
MTEKTNPSSDESEIARAAALLRSGGLVAFPTETVYGLGANALDAQAVERIFEVKGRPPTSPLIVHVASIHLARLIVSEWPLKADLLAHRFWPGPLTLVLRKHANISLRVTAGLDTVGIRVPAHPLALDLLRAAGVPVAAPSANRFGAVSPTCAAHVRASLGDRVDMILDGGPTDVGIESTVLSIVEEPTLLRPGMILQEQIEGVIGPVIMADAPVEGLGHESPGMHSRHYSPVTKLIVVGPGDVLPPGRCAYMFITAPRGTDKGIPMPDDAERYAAMLYQTLLDLDAGGYDWIAVEAPPKGGAWTAIHDRLRRAAAKQGTPNPLL